MALDLLLDMNLFDVNIWLILIASIVLFLGATYIGFFLGRRVHQSGVDEHSRTQISTIQVAILGLLALLHHLSPHPITAAAAPPGDLQPVASIRRCAAGVLRRRR